MMKRLIKMNEINNSTINSLCNWIENKVEISESDYSELIKNYSTSGICYRVLGFEINDIEKAISNYYNIDLYDDNSSIKTSKSDFLNALKTMIIDDDRICSWTNNIDSIKDLINDASDYYEIIIIIKANVNGIDINKVIEDNKDQMEYLLYTYQNEVLGKQSNISQIIDVYISNNKLNFPENGNLHDYINLFE